MIKLAYSPRSVPVNNTPRQQVAAAVQAASLVQLQQVDSALLQACAGGDESAMKHCIEEGADAMRARDPMAANCGHMAALGGHLRVAVWLPSRLQALPDAQGILPVHFAAHNGWLELVAYFLEGEKGLQESRLKEWLALEHDELGLKSKAEQIQGNKVGTLDENEVKRRMIEAIESADAHGGTLLHHAALGGHLPVLRYLLYHGANINCLTVDGLTALKVAQQVGHVHVLILLRAYSIHQADLASTTDHEENDEDQAAFEEAEAEAERFRQNEIHRLLAKDSEEQCKLQKHLAADQTSTKADTGIPPPEPVKQALPPEPSFSMRIAPVLRPTPIDTSTSSTQKALEPVVFLPPTQKTQDVSLAADKTIQDSAASLQSVQAKAELPLKQEESINKVEELPVIPREIGRVDNYDHRPRHRHRRRKRSRHRGDDDDDRDRHRRRRRRRNDRSPVSDVEGQSPRHRSNYYRQSPPSRRRGLSPAL